MAAKAKGLAVAKTTIVQEKMPAKVRAGSKARLKNALQKAANTSHPANKQALFGVGLRKEHFSRLETQLETQLDFFEILLENHLRGGRPETILAQIATAYPLSFHGVGLNIGAASEPDLGYWQRIKTCFDRYQPFLVSDHLCWTGLPGAQLHNLLPLPYTAQNLRVLSERIQRLQDFLGRQMAFENVSAYFNWQASELPEWEFLAELAEAADCLILLDLNNLYVNACNQGFATADYLQALPAERVAQYHLAGYTAKPGFFFDTHANPVYPEVWELYRQALNWIGPRPTLIEWDTDIPPFEVLEAEALTARAIWQTRCPV